MWYLTKNQIKHYGQAQVSDDCGIECQKKDHLCEYSNLRTYTPKIVMCCTTSLYCVFFLLVIPNNLTSTHNGQNTPIKAAQSSVPKWTTPESIIKECGCLLVYM